MNIPKQPVDDVSGFVLIEMLMVFVILGTLASIALPHYADYRDKALSAQCLANRYHIEMEEQAYFLENGRPGLMISEKYSCPSGGTYVWLVSDPDEEGYPRIGCSVHYAGPVTEDLTIPSENPGPGDVPPEDVSPLKLLDNLINSVYNLNVTNSLEKSLVKMLTKAETAIEEGNQKSAVKNLDNFLKQIENNQKKGKILTSEADLLIAIADELKRIL